MSSDRVGKRKTKGLFSEFRFLNVSQAKLNELADTMAGVDELISIRSTEFNQGMYNLYR